jgi:hypothetical protein
MCRNEFMGISRAAAKDPDPGRLKAAQKRSGSKFPAAALDVNCQDGFSTDRFLLILR